MELSLLVVKDDKYVVQPAKYWMLWSEQNCMLLNNIVSWGRSLLVLQVLIVSSSMHAALTSTQYMSMHVSRTKEQEDQTAQTTVAEATVQALWEFLPLGTNLVLDVLTLTDSYFVIFPFGSFHQIGNLAALPAYG